MLLVPGSSTKTDLTLGVGWWDHWEDPQIAWQNVSLVCFDHMTILGARSYGRVGTGIGEAVGAYPFDLWVEGR